MYGLIIGGIEDTIKKKFGEDTWKIIEKKSGIRTADYLPKKAFSETIIPRVIKQAVEITDTPADELLEACGQSFLSYITNYGYDRLLMVLGRDLRDFINSLDNLHDYIRVSYPKLKPPSFYCENETETGLTLHYRSRRRGFAHYVIGQITEIAKVIYNTTIQVDLLSEDETMSINHYIMRLNFDNSAHVKGPTGDKGVNTLPVDSRVISEVFPFHVIFGSDMLIRGLGDGIAKVMPNALGQAVDEMFHLVRPQSEFTMETIHGYSNCAFEVISTQSLRRDLDTMGNTINNTLDEINDYDDDKTTKEMMERRLRLKGQMAYFKQGDYVLYLGTPLMSSLDTMFSMGIFINDLSLHDSSRELVLASTQQATELKMALTTEKSKSAKLTEMLASVDKEMKRTDALLYQMIPKAVATRLRNGEPSMNTCQIFESVTILFTDVVGFTSICSKLTPMLVVDMLNEMYSRFDLLTVKHRVYKVETIGDAYMVVSGAPNVTTFHACYISNMAFDMVEAMRDMEDPSKGPGSNMNIRVGIHTGPVVGGVVGLKMPRYCLVGVSVQTANLMESSGSAMRVHISVTTRKELERYPFLVEYDRQVELKSGGTIKTYWLTGKDPDSNVKIPVAGGAEDKDD